MTQPASFYDRVEAAHAIPLWRRGESGRSPMGQAVPFVLRWQIIRPLLEEAAQFAVGEEVNRRVLSLANPGIAFTAAATENLGAGFQMILPGEVAPSHRHSMAALRWIVEAKPGDACTVVDGEPLAMEENDLILTPPGSWHDHRHQGLHPVIWLDGLDSPLIRRLSAAFFEKHPLGVQQEVPLSNVSLHRLGPAAVRAPEIRPGGPLPLLRFPFTVALPAVERLAQSAPPDPWEGYRADYVNPATGGPILPTIACSLLHLPPGFSTRPRRQVSSAVYFGVRGAGFLEAKGERWRWSEKDTLAVPCWTEHRWINDSPNPAILFRFSDRPMYEALGLTMWEETS